MSNVIELLERMGQDANLQSSENKELLVNSSQLPNAVKQSLIAADSEALAKKLKTDKEIICFLIPAKDDEPDTDEQEPEDTNSVVNG